MMTRKRKKAAHRKGIVTASVLNVRLRPSTGKPVVGKLNRGTIVIVLEQVDGWYKIKKGNLDGYVHGSFITMQDDNPASGYLFEREDLRKVGLAPSPEEQIGIDSSLSSMQKLVSRVWNGHGGLLKVLSNIISVDLASSIAVLCVESGGKGFGSDGRMVIRFENHVFWREWGKNNQSKFGEHFRYDPNRSWTRHEFREKISQNWLKFHGDQNLEWKVFEFARGLHSDAAMKSISMGGPQIMGFNHTRIGYESVKSMFDAFESDIRYHILGLFDFIKGPGTTSRMIQALQLKDFITFATFYNGSGQAAQYGDLIEQYFRAFKSINM